MENINDSCQSGIWRQTRAPINMRFHSTLWRWKGENTSAVAMAATRNFSCRQASILLSRQWLCGVLCISLNVVIRAVMPATTSWPVDSVMPVTLKWLSPVWFCKHLMPARKVLPSRDIPEWELFLVWNLPSHQFHEVGVAVPIHFSRWKKDSMSWKFSTYKLYKLWIIKLRISVTLIIIFMCLTTSFTYSDVRLSTSRPLGIFLLTTLCDQLYEVRTLILCFHFFAEDSALVNFSFSLV